jgi:DNA-binding MarR family transcriptional regulator|tara:strand:+ start:12969 stop:13475 length:507 start_codon:yes stop_codon:yes gene_type:complete
MDVATSNQYDKSALRRLIRCVKELRQLSPEMTLQAAHTFLVVAAEPGIPTPELMKRTAVSQSSCSRHVGFLSHRHHKGAPGLQLVESLIDPYEGRRKIVVLTDKGKELAAELAEVLGTTQPYSQEILQQVRELREKSMEITSEAEAATELALGLEELIEDESMSVATG